MKSPEKIFKTTFFVGAALLLIAMVCLLVFEIFTMILVLIGIFLWGIALGVELVDNYYRQNKKG